MTPQQHYDETKCTPAAGTLSDKLLATANIKQLFIFWTALYLTTTLRRDTGQPNAVC